MLAKGNAGREHDSWIASLLLRAFAPSRAIFPWSLSPTPHPLPLSNKTTGHTHRPRRGQQVWPVVTVHDQSFLHFRGTYFTCFACIRQEVFFDRHGRIASRVRSGRAIAFFNLGATDLPSSGWPCESVKDTAMARTPRPCHPILILKNADGPGLVPLRNERR